MSTTTIFVGGDTFIRQSASTTNYNGETYMALGKTGTSSQVDRILMGFDLSGLSGKIIDAAVLNMYQDYSTYAYSAELPFTAHCISSSWSAGSVNWSNQPSYTANGAVNLFLSGNADGWREFNVSALIQDIIHNARTYYGILLKQTNESTGNLRKQFFTEEYGSESRQAYLYVTYHDMNLWGYAGGAFQLADEVYVYQSGAWRTSATGSAVYQSGAWRSFK
ncbi:MAG: DNRLRE domain-containing protein [Eubacteriales bacterium]|nr:DNRLRE domain-containing protein [Eubacteriales bacterium]